MKANGPSPGRSRPGGRAGEPGDRALEGDEGNRDPRRPVGELVPELVERLVELVGAQSPVEPLALGRHERRLAGPRRPRRGTRPGTPCAPRPPTSPPRACRRSASRASWGLASRRRAEGDLRRVRERAEHPGHVLQDALLGAALRQRPRGLALEVQDGEAVRRPQELAEVVVAVDADLQTPPAARASSARSSSPRRAPSADDPLRALAERRRELREPGGERLAGAAELRQHRFAPERPRRPP